MRFQELRPPACPANGFCPVIDGLPSDPNRIDITVKLGTTEEWLVTNESTEEHPFHIHVNPFQVTAINGAPAGLPRLLRPITLSATTAPAHAPGLTDLVGKFVIHCHSRPPRTRA